VVIPAAKSTEVAGVTSGKSFLATFGRPAALEIFQRIGTAEAAGVSAELDAVIEAQPAAPGS
jgi:hypothetical protein